MNGKPWSKSQEKKKKKKWSTETEQKMAQMLGLADKYFQVVIQIYFKGKSVQWIKRKCGCKEWIEREFQQRYENYERKLNENSRNEKYSNWSKKKSLDALNNRLEMVGESVNVKTRQ